MGTGAGNRRQNELDAGKAANYDPAVRQRFDSWYHDAISKGYVMVVTFNPRGDTTHRANARDKHLTARKYAHYVAAFIRAHPAVEIYDAFNEPNLRTAPTAEEYRGAAGGPDLAARMTDNLQRICTRTRSDGSPTCSVIAGSLSDGKPGFARYVRRLSDDLFSYNHDVSRPGPTPDDPAWGWHPYDDVTGQSTAHTDAYVAEIRASRGNLFRSFWLTEIGGRRFKCSGAGIDACQDAQGC